MIDPDFANRAGSRNCSNTPGAWPKMSFETSTSPLVPSAKRTARRCPARGRTCLTSQGTPPPMLAAESSLVSASSRKGPSPATIPYGAARPTPKSTPAHARAMLREMTLSVRMSISASLSPWIARKCRWACGARYAGAGDWWCARLERQENEKAGNERKRHDLLRVKAAVRERGCGCEHLASLERQRNIRSEIGEIV